MRCSACSAWLWLLWAPWAQPLPTSERQRAERVAERQRHDREHRAQRQANAGRIAIFAGVNLATAMAALQQSKDDVAVATQMIMRDKLRRMGGVYDKARRKDAAAPATEEVTWRSKAGDQRRHRSTTTAAKARARPTSSAQPTAAPRTARSPS